MNDSKMSYSLGAVLLAIAAVASVGAFFVRNRETSPADAAAAAPVSERADSRPTRGLRLEHRGRSAPGGHRGRPKGPRRVNGGAGSYLLVAPPCITTPPWFSTR